MKKYKNNQYLEAIKESFEIYLKNGSSTSNEKLKPLHSAFAKDLKERFDNEYIIKSLGLDGVNGKEGIITGKYADKKVDISVFDKDRPIGGFAIKFAMRNVAQNLVNYFDNMLGETVNIRSVSVPYFQVLILFDKIPYFDEKKTI